MREHWHPAAVAAAIKRVVIFAVALLFGLPAIAAAAGPQHVMSLSLCTDALLLELLPPSRIASVTYLSRAPSNSYLWPQAAEVAVNYGNPEEVLAARPDFVVAGTYAAAAARALIKKTNIPLLEVPTADNFDQIRAVTRTVAHALGRDAVAEALIARMDGTLQELSASRPHRLIRVAAWNGDGSVPGRGTLFDAILTAAGGVNIAAGDAERDGSFDLEELLAARPDVLAYGSDTSTTPSLHTDAALHPLILGLYAGRRVSYPSALYGCGVVESADAAVALRSGLLLAVNGG